MKPKNKNQAIWFVAFYIAMLILSCLFLAANIYLITIDALNLHELPCVASVLIIIALCSVCISIRLRLIRELKNKQCDECKIVNLYPLFEHMSNEHGLTLLDQEMFEIIDVVNKIQNEK